MKTRKTRKTDPTPVVSQDAVDFASLLNEALQEIRKLRAKREWHGGDVASASPYKGQFQWDKPSGEKELAPEQNAALASAAERLKADEIFTAAHDR